MVEGALSATEKIHSRLNGVEVATAFGGPPLIANQEAVPPRDVIEVDRWLKLYIYGCLRQTGSWFSTFQSRHGTYRRPRRPARSHPPLNWYLKRSSAVRRKLRFRRSHAEVDRHQTIR